MKNKLSIAFYWHHHQPYYKDASGVFQMPWVRLHGTKDYLDFLLYLKEFPEIKQNINLVPSLLMQIEDYVKNDARDLVWVLSEKAVNDLTDDEKKYIINNFFMANSRTMIEPYQRYSELYKAVYMYKKYLPEDEIIKRLSEQDFRDIQFWYNLTWIGEKSKERKPIAKLLKKGGNFKESEKPPLFKEIIKILEEIIPVHKELRDNNQIDLTTTPFYHPILPLVCDNYIAKESTPDMQLPSIQFKHPEDAEVHVSRAIKCFKKLFNRMPDGMWPAEGSVSNEAISLISKYGIPYLATDEGVLEHSLKREFNYLDIYKPYCYKVNDKNVHMFFRDHNLSDAIGFVYSSRPAEQAVRSFMDQILEIRKKLIQKNGTEYLDKQVVSIILDGENCWEYYPNDGKDFITLLFKELSNSDLIETVRYSEFIDSQKQQAEKLEHIHPGSWINHNFKIWIGAEEDNKAWDLLAQTRNFLVKETQEGIHSEEVVKEAWEEIYIAEGSDWNWWYGDEHSSEMDMEFDKLYRSHLIRVYQLLNSDIPGELFQTIKRKHFITFEMKYPQNLINPSIDGERTHFYEWNGSAVYDCSKTQLQSTMHQVSKIMDKVHIGFNKENLFFRIDFNQKPSMVAEYVINILTPRKTTLVFSPLKQIGEAFWWEDEKNNKKVITKDVKLKEILEIGFPFGEIGLKQGDKIGFQIQIKQNGHILEQFPTISLVELILPDDNYETIEWFV